MPRCGTDRICCRTLSNCRRGPSASTRSSHTGYMLVNHPTLLVRSAPTNSSSRPCPSTSTFTPLSPLHSQTLSTSPANNTSCNSLPSAFPTSLTSLSVSSSLSPTTTVPPDSPLF